MLVGLPKGFLTWILVKMMIVSNIEEDANV